MPTLRQVQQRFTADILAYARGHQSPSQAARHLRVPAGVDWQTRLDIYRNGYPARILESLGEAFPATANILGDGSFANLVRRYLAGVDLHSYNLNDVGERLADHCRADPLSEELPFLGDLASLEWAILRAFHSRDREPVDPTAFATYDMEDWERAVLEFQPSLAVVESAWPIRDLRDTMNVDRADIAIDLVDRPQVVLVHRRGLDVDVRVIDRRERDALETMRSGVTLASAMENLHQAGQSPEDVMRMFGAWIADGLITAVRLASAYEPIAKS